MIATARTTRGGLDLHPRAPRRGQIWERHGCRRVIESSRATFSSRRYAVIYTIPGTDRIGFCYANEWELWAACAALVMDRPRRITFDRSSPEYLPAPITINAADRHRDTCADTLGLTQDMLAVVCDWRYRGPAVPNRERLIVAMRETPTEAGVLLSFLEITRALRAKNHSTIITAYQRAKAKGVDRLAFATHATTKDGQ